MMSRLVDTKHPESLYQKIETWYVVLTLVLRSYLSLPSPRLLDVLQDEG